jgi:3-oxoacyl-[acyl-carrier-protein] synthase-1
MAEHPFMVDKAGEPMVVCADSFLSPDVSGVDRLLQLALPALKEALDPLIERQRRARVSVFIGLPESRPGRPRDLEATFIEGIRSALAGLADLREIECHSLGNAAGLLCLESAREALMDGSSGFCLVGGVESYLEPETLEWLDANDHLHSESTIWGFCPGEGSGFALLTSAGSGDALHLPVMAEVIAVGSASEPNRINTETVCIGDGLSTAFRKTLSSLPPTSRVNHTICDMNGEPYRGDEYGFAMLRSNRWFDDMAGFSTPADCWGDMGAASGPLFVLLAAAAYQKDYSLGSHTFLWASSDGGLRACALMRTAQESVG